MDNTKWETNAAWCGKQAAAEQAQGRPQRREKLDSMEAVRWAFSTVWHNPRVWVLGTLLLAVAVLIALGLLSLILVAIEHALGGDLTERMQRAAGWELPAGFGPEIALIPLLVTPPLYAGALAQVSHPRIGYRDFFRNTRYWRVVVVSLAGTVFWWAVDYLVSAAIPPRFEDVGYATSLWYLLGSFIGGVLALCFTVLTHLFTLAWAWYVADGYGFGDAVVEGSKAVWRNAIRLTLLYVVGMILSMLGMVLTLMLGALVIAPASLLLAAHLCRQANGGELPRA